MYRLNLPMSDMERRRRKLKREREKTEGKLSR
jgi:hypothetical protein